MKRTLMILALMAIMFGMASATDTRVATFGPASMFINDYTDIYFLPANAVYYPRLIAAEMGASFPVASDTNWSYGSAAMLFSNAEQTFGVVGFDINHDIEGSDFLSTATGSFGIPGPDNRFHVFYAKKLNNLTAGLHIGWAGASATQDSKDTTNAYSVKSEGSSNLWLINGEVMMEASENASAELSIGLMMQSFNGTIANSWRTPPVANYENNLESDGGMGLQMELRAEYGMSDNLKLIPIIDFGTNSIGYKSSSTDTTFHPRGGKKSETNFGGAFGCNYKPVENVTIVGGLFIGSETATIEDTTQAFTQDVDTLIDYKKEEYNTFIFPGFCVGLEVDLLKWLTLRAGVAKTLENNSTKMEEYQTLDMTVIETSATTAPYFYAFGLGFKFGKLAIDAKVNNNLPYSMGYLMSGINNGGIDSTGNTTQPITSIGMTYSF